MRTNAKFEKKRFPSVFKGLYQQKIDIDRLKSCLIFHRRNVYLNVDTVFFTKRCFYGYHFINKDLVKAFERHFSNSFTDGKSEISSSHSYYILL